MSTLKFTRRALVAAAAATLSLGAPVFAGGHQVVDLSLIHISEPTRRS